MNRRYALSILLAAVLAVGAPLLAGPAHLFGVSLSSAASAAETVEVKEMVLGSEDAPIEFIEYASFTCPHCASFHENTFKKLKQEYIDTGKVRFVFREVYFDRPGLWAGMVARCGGEDRYFGLTAMLFEKQREWIGNGEAGQIAQNLRRIGKSAGLTDEELDSCLSNADLAQAMIDVFEENMKTHEISGTPSLVIDGKLYSNMSYEQIKEILDQKLTE